MTPRINAVNYLAVGKPEPTKKAARKPPFASCRPGRALAELACYSVA
jgi:hypothetical protein